jgi:hypothetical protein
MSLDLGIATSREEANRMMKNHKAKKKKKHKRKITELSRKKNRGKK